MANFIPSLTSDFLSFLTTLELALSQLPYPGRDWYFSWAPFFCFLYCTYPPLGRLNLTTFWDQLMSSFGHFLAGRSLEAKGGWDYRPSFIASIAMIALYGLGPRSNIRPDLLFDPQQGLLTYCLTNHLDLLTY